MIEIEEKAVPVFVDIKGGEVTANIQPADDISVTVGESAVMDATAAINYVKSGEAEINRYVNNVSKPEIDRYVEDTAEPLVAQIIEEQAEPVINAYVDNEVIPNINSVADSTLTAFNNNASAKTTAFNDNASAKTTAFDNNAASAIATIEPLVTTATSAATAASTSATNAATSASNASSSASDALSAKNAAVAAKDAAESAATDANVVAVGTDLRASPSKIKTVANNIADVNAVSNDIFRIYIVANNLNYIYSAYENLSDIQTVASNIGDVSTVAGISSDVSVVANIDSDITSVSAISSAVSTVAGNTTNINTVASNNTNISTVATNISDVNTVATNTSDIATVVANITDIQNAASNAAKARDWAVKMEGKIDGDDYSAKYYAAKAEEAAASVGDPANRDLSNLTATGEAKFTAKQDVISDLATIRSGAALGATAVQPSDLATVATSGAYSDLSGKPNLSNYVDISTNQNIAGVKTFQSATYNTVPLNDSRTGMFIARNMNYTLGTNPSSNKVSQIQIRDSADDWTSLFQYSYQTDGQVNISMQCRKQDKSASSVLAIGYKPDGSFFSYVPVCDAANSIVTTVNKSKAANGYFQLGNGLIVQWGTVATTTATSGTVTYPKAFTSAASRAILNASASGVVAYPSAEQTTGFTWNKTSTNCAIKWIAIGY